MEQSLSWEANRFSASQEIPRILRNPKVHYLFLSSGTSDFGGETGGKETTWETQA